MNLDVVNYYFGSSATKPSLNDVLLFYYNDLYGAGYENGYFVIRSSLSKTKIRLKVNIENCLKVG